MMKRFSFLLLVMLCLAATVSAAEFEFAGTWKNVDSTDMQVTMDFRADSTMGIIIGGYQITEKAYTAYRMEQAESDSLLYITMDIPADMRDKYGTKRIAAMRLTIRLIGPHTIALLKSLEMIDESGTIARQDDSGEKLFERAQ